MLHFLSLTIFCWRIFVEFELGCFKISMKQEYVLQNYAVVSLFSFHFCAQSCIRSLPCRKNGVSDG